MGQRGEACRWRVYYQRWLPCLVNRPGLAGTVLQTPLWFIDWLSHPFPPNLQKSLHLNLKSKRVEVWRECLPPPRVTYQVSRVRYHVSGVMSQVSRVRCHVVGVTCYILHIYIFFLRTKWWGQLVEGLLSMGPPRLVSSCFQKIPLLMSRMLISPISLQVFFIF